MANTAPDILDIINNEIEKLQSSGSSGHIDVYPGEDAVEQPDAYIRLSTDENDTSQINVEVHGTSGDLQDFTVDGAIELDSDAASAISTWGDEECPDSTLTIMEDFESDEVSPTVDEGIVGQSFTRMNRDILNMEVGDKLEFRPDNWQPGADGMSDTSITAEKNEDESVTIRFNDYGNYEYDQITIGSGESIVPGSEAYEKLADWHLEQCPDVPLMSSEDVQRTYEEYRVEMSPGEEDIEQEDYQSEVPGVDEEFVDEEFVDGETEDEQEAVMGSEELPPFIAADTPDGSTSEESTTPVVQSDGHSLTPEQASDYHQRIDNLEGVTDEERADLHYAVEFLEKAPTLISAINSAITDATESLYKLILVQNIAQTDAIESHKDYIDTKVHDNKHTPEELGVLKEKLQIFADKAIRAYEPGFHVSNLFYACASKLSDLAGTVSNTNLMIKDGVDHILSGQDVEKNKAYLSVLHSTVEQFGDISQTADDIKDFVTTETSSTTYESVIDDYMEANYSGQYTKDPNDGIWKNQDGEPLEARTQIDVSTIRDVLTPKGLFRGDTSEKEQSPYLPLITDCKPDNLGRNDLFTINTAYETEHNVLSYIGRAPTLFPNNDVQAYIRSQLKSFLTNMWPTADKDSDRLDKTDADTTEADKGKAQDVKDVVEVLDATIAGFDSSVIVNKREVFTEDTKPQSTETEKPQKLDPGAERAARVSELESFFKEVDKEIKVIDGEIAELKTALYKVSLAENIDSGDLSIAIGRVIGDVNRSADNDPVRTLKDKVATAVERITDVKVEQVTAREIVDKLTDLQHERKILGEISREVFDSDKGLITNKSEITQRMKANTSTKNDVQALESKKAIADKALESVKVINAPVTLKSIDTSTFDAKIDKAMTEKAGDSYSPAFAKDEKGIYRDKDGNPIAAKVFVSIDTTKDNKDIVNARVSAITRKDPMFTFSAGHMLTLKDKYERGVDSKIATYSGDLTSGREVGSLIFNLFGEQDKVNPNNPDGTAKKIIDLIGGAYEDSKDTVIKTEKDDGAGKDVESRSESDSSRKDGTDNEAKSERDQDGFEKKIDIRSLINRSRYGRTNSDGKIAISKEYAERLRAEAKDVAAKTGRPENEIFNEKKAAAEIKLQRLADSIEANAQALSRYNVFPMPPRGNPRYAALTHDRVALIRQYMNAGGAIGKDCYLQQGCTVLDSIMTFRSVYSVNPIMFLIEEIVASHEESKVEARMAADQTDTIDKTPKDTDKPSDDTTTKDDKPDDATADNEKTDSDKTDSDRVDKDEEPVKDVEADEKPAEDVEADEEPVEDVDADEEPVEDVEADKEPVVEADKDPVEAVDADEEQPVEDVEADEEPVEDVEADEEPVEDIEADEEPAEDVEADEEPVEDVKADEEPVEDVKADEEPVEDVEADAEPIEDVKENDESQPTTLTENKETSTENTRNGDVVAEAIASDPSAQRPITSKEEENPDSESVDNANEQHSKDADDTSKSHVDTANTHSESQDTTTPDSMVTQGERADAVVEEVKGQDVVRTEEPVSMSEIIKDCVSGKATLEETLDRIDDYITSKTEHSSVVDTMKDVADAISTGVSSFAGDISGMLSDFVGEVSQLFGHAADFFSIMNDSLVANGYDSESITKINDDALQVIDKGTIHDPLVAEVFSTELVQDPETGQVTAEDAGTPEMVYGDVDYTIEQFEADQDAASRESENLLEAADANGVELAPEIEQASFEQNALMDTAADEFDPTTTTTNNNQEVVVPETVDIPVEVAQNTGTEGLEQPLEAQVPEVEYTKPEEPIVIEQQESDPADNPTMKNSEVTTPEEPPRQEDDFDKFDNQSANDTDPTTLPEDDDDFEVAGFLD